MNAPVLPEVLLRHGVDAQTHAQTPLPLASEGVRRWVWESRYGAMLIEVIDDEVFVNGQRVQRHQAKLSSQSGNQADSQSSSQSSS